MDASQRKRLQMQLSDLKSNQDQVARYLHDANSDPEVPDGLVRALAERQLSLKNEVEHLQAILSGG